MATLAYTAIRPDGSLVTGKGEAASEEALGNLLARERLELVEVKEVGKRTTGARLQRTTPCPPRSRGGRVRRASGSSRPGWARSR